VELQKTLHAIEDDPPLRNRNHRLFAALITERAGYQSTCRIDINVDELLEMVDVSPLRAGGPIYEYMYLASLCFAYDTYVTISFTIIARLTLSSLCFRSSGLAEPPLSEVVTLRASPRRLPEEGFLRN
jgi:hypothetical protein